MRLLCVTNYDGAQLKGERSFHIFYQLVRGASAAEREAFRLPAKVQEFQFLSQVRAGHRKWACIISAKRNAGGGE